VRIPVKITDEIVTQINRIPTYSAIFIHLTMRLINFELLQAALSEKSPRLKFIANEDAVLFFPDHQQHRSAKIAGVSYEDDYKGNAVAGIVNGEQVEIRFHAAFSDNRILNLWTLILVTAQKLDIHLADFTLHYQGRKLK